MPARLRKLKLMDRIPEGSRLVTRGTRYGNPFRRELHDDGEGGKVWIVVDIVGTQGREPDHVMGEWKGDAAGRAAARAEAVRLFREWVYSDDPKGTHVRIQARQNLRGRDVVCMCDFLGPCHGEVLLEIANA